MKSIFVGNNLGGRFPAQRFSMLILAEAESGENRWADPKIAATLLVPQKSTFHHRSPHLPT
jgi:hypothetical protein